MLDAVEYNRRIDRLNADISRIHAADEVKLLKILADLKRQSDAQHTSGEDQTALSLCVRQLQIAEANYNRDLELNRFRGSAKAALKKYKNELVKLRDNSPRQTNTVRPDVQAASGASKPSTDFLQTTPRTEETDQTGVAPLALKDESASNGRIEIVATQIPPPEVLNRRSEKRSDFLGETQTLLEKTKVDFTIRLEKLEKSLLGDDPIHTKALLEKTKSDFANRLEKLEKSLADDHQQNVMRYTALESAVEEQSIRVARITATYAEMQTHWTEIAQLLKLCQGAEQAAQSIEGGAASCSRPLRRFLETLVATAGPALPPQADRRPSADMPEAHRAP